MVANPHGHGEKKLYLLFTSSKGKKRLFGKSMWTREGLEYFYMVEMNQKKGYVGTKMREFPLPVMDMPVRVLGSVHVLAFF
jgi:hypothetical protein